MSKKVSVDNQAASRVLASAYKAACNGDVPKCGFEAFIKRIITGSHLTFRYILFTALLAKATDNRVNPLCLQVGSDLDGAYDARSLCHGVIVPFEKESLKKILGGSNEPYLNKPARFPELNRNNPVRRGNDQAELNDLCDNLPKINSSEKASKCLRYFLSVALQLIDERDEQEQLYLSKAKADRIVLADFLRLLLRENHEGESLTLVVANVYNLLYSDNKNMTIEVHPVNQCGASSKEISDMDIKEDGVLIIANELKDKDFTETDIEHALDKVVGAGGDQMFFIVGRNASFVGKDLNSVIAKYRKMNVSVNVVPIDAFLDIVYPLCRDASMDKVITYSAGVLKDKKFKKSTADYFYTTIDLIS